MARKKAKLLTTPTPKVQESSWASVGIDISLSSISGAMTVYDALMDELKGPGLHQVRWERPVHFLDRLAQATQAGNFVLDLLSETCSASIPLDRFWIGVEEAWPAGIVKKADSRWLRQQAQVQGAFMGGLRKYGYTKVEEVNAQLWKNPIREETGIGRPDKWDVKKWALESFAVPDFPDLIKHGTRGLIPKPDTSRAKPVQPDDRYDALGILEYMDGIRMEELA